MEKLRFYLLGCKFVVRVDHKPLVAMLQNKLNVMMEDWVDTILHYDFITQYLPREQNGLADALSRSYDTTIVEPKVKTSSVKPGLSNTSLEVVLAMEAERRRKIIPTIQERISLVEKAHTLGHFSVEMMFRKL